MLGAIRDAEASGTLTRYVYVHDALDRVITVSNAGTADAPLTVFDYAYDAVGNRIERSERVEGASAGSVAYEYDRLDRLTRVQESGAAVADKAVEFSYDAVGNLARLDRYADLNDAEEVLATLYGHDAADRLTRVRHGEAWLPHAYYGYTLDAASRVTDILAPDGTAAFDYDSRGQLTDADHAHQTDEAYSYDANGNRTGGGQSTGDHNRLLSDGVYSYQYDGEGNRTRRTEIATGDYVTYEWDYRNRLTSVTFYNAGGAKQKQVVYGYDTADRRLSKSVDANGDGSFDQTARYVYSGDNVTLVFDAQGDQTHRYLHGPAVDQILADEDALGDVFWPLADHQGTVREVAQYDLDTDITTIAEEITYNAFGAITSGPTEQTFTYTGREWDADAELYYYRARWYDPAAARFLSPDPSGFEAGDANLYRYVNNSPVTFVDPSGLHVTTPKSSLFGSPDIYVSGLQLPPAQSYRPSSYAANASSIAALSAAAYKARVAPANVAPYNPYTQARVTGLEQDFRQEEWARHNRYGTSDLLIDAASVVFEPLDTIGTIVEVAADPGDLRSYAGFAPFVPAAVGKAAKRVPDLKHATFTPLGRVDDVGYHGSAVAPQSVYYDVGRVPGPNPNNLRQRVVTIPTAGEGGVYLKPQGGRTKIGSTSDFRGRYGANAPDGIEVEIPQTRIGPPPGVDDSAYPWSEEYQRRFDEEYLDRLTPADVRYRAPNKPQSPVSQRKWELYRHIFGYGDVPADFGY